MLALKLLLIVAGALLFAAALAIPLYSLFKRMQIVRKNNTEPEAAIEPDRAEWRRSIPLTLAGIVPLLIALSIVVVPSGMGGVRVSQVSGTLPGTLYPGTHFITPLVDSVQMFDLRDHMFAAGLGAQPTGKTAAERACLDVQSREGLKIGLGVTVRYRLDPGKLSSVQARLPQPADQQIVPPAVHGARDLLNQARRGAHQG